MSIRSLMRLGLAHMLASAAFALLFTVLAPELVRARPLATGRTYPGPAPCDTTLQACISGSADGDSIVIAAGTYLTASLNISRAVSLIGGGAGPSAVKLHPTGGRMIQYSSAPLTASFVISNLSVENGNSSASSGGGIRVSSGGVPLFYNIIVSNNTGSGGGGIRIIPAEPATMISVVVLSNTSAADGGGILASGSLTLIDSRIELNSAGGSGGGMDIGGELSLVNTLIGRNDATAGGGGAFVRGAASLVGGSFERNVASDANGLGGGLLVSNALSLTGTSFLTNSAVAGGGAYVSGTLTLTDAQFISNTAVKTSALMAFAIASDGAGLYAVGPAALSGGRFERNASLNGGSGGGMFAAKGLTVSGTQFVHNDAGRNSHGGGLAVSGTLTLSGGLFYGNQATDGGGGAHVLGSALVSGARFENNGLTFTGGGGLRVFGGFARITNTLFISNTGDDGSGLELITTSDSRIVNSLFARNHVANGAALAVGGSGRTAILHVTVADTSLNPGTAIRVEGGIVGITDTIMLNHSVGINQTAGSVSEDYNLFFTNGSDRLGTVTIGSHSFNGNPAFVNPTTDNDHLGPASAAIDQGIGAGVTFDVDGDSRPQGNGFDIGYDEATYSSLFLPLIMR